MDMGEFDLEVRRKQQLARKLIHENVEKKKELCDQIEVCEGLFLPLTEEMIIGLALLPLREMQREIRRHKQFV